MILYSEYRLIERETEISIAWKGAHLLLFFLAFLFGCFCTFCFHMISYMFDEQCVLFPKLLTLNKERNSMLYSFLPLEGTPADWPVDFITTQWVEKNVCVLPMFIPLVSGIFGLVWTTMFVMCTSSLSQHGCSYTINVISLAYSRRIRGVYQATWLIILSAWLHSICWVLAAIVAMLRIGLAVDFNLICVTATLEGNYEKLLQQNESQIRLTEPEFSASALADNEELTHDDDVQKETTTKTHIFFQGNHSSTSESTLITPSFGSKSNKESTESIQPETSVGNKKTLSFSNIGPEKDTHSDSSLRRRPVSDNTLNAKETKAPDWIRPARSSLKDKRSYKDIPESHHVSIREPKLYVQKVEDKKKKDKIEKKKDDHGKKQDKRENKHDEPVNIKDEYENKKDEHENKKYDHENKEDEHENKKDEDENKKDDDKNDDHENKKVEHDDKKDENENKEGEHDNKNEDDEKNKNKDENKKDN